MVEFESIQLRGFHNIFNDDEQAIGFEFDFVSPYYKGLWFSQCRFGNVSVDNETFDKDDIVYNYKGVDYTREDFFDCDNLYWQFRDKLTVRVFKSGGLPIGYHDIGFSFGWVCNYNSEGEKEYDGSGLGNSGFMYSPHFKRRMLLAR